jgi:predicted amidophosphoribosyltransferase
MNPVEHFRHLEKGVCPECGEPIEVHDHAYLNECDHCLSKKAE